MILQRIWCFFRGHRPVLESVSSDRVWMRCPRCGTEYRSRWWTGDDSVRVNRY